MLDAAVEANKSRTWPKKDIIFMALHTQLSSVAKMVKCEWSIYLCNFLDFLSKNIFEEKIEKQSKELEMKMKLQHMSYTVLNI